MSALKFKIDASAEKKLRKSIAEQAGKQLKTIFGDLHQKILDATPMNTGRTLGSWAASVDKALLIDIADTDGRDQFIYSPARPETNTTPIGSEPGRNNFVRMSLATADKIDFLKNPYRIFFVSNGAKLDSGFIEWPDGNVTESLPSGLPQAAGSRAMAQEYGQVPGYDVFGSSDLLTRFPFNPRGILGASIWLSSVSVFNTADADF